MKTYWQAEIYRNNELYDIDFPRREQKLDAISDARDRLATLSARERQAATAEVSEWTEADGGSVNTGRSESVE